MTPNDVWLELLSDIAHDLKTPISATRGYVELIQYSGPLNEKQHHYSERALTALQHMERLVASLVDIAWLDADKPLELSVCDLQVLVDEAIALVETIAAGRRIRIGVYISASTGLLLGDASRLSQVVYNLIGNAVKYNRDGGEVTVTASGTRDSATVSVRDTGIGISAEDQARIFDRFFRARTSPRAKTEGSGLGLAIVRGIVEKHGGRIDVESAPGVGSTFTLTLPRTPADAQGLTASAGDMAALMEQGNHGGAVTGAGEIGDAVDDDLQESDDRERPEREDDEI